MHQDDKEQGADSSGASAAGMPSDSSQGGGLRHETSSSGTGSQTRHDTGETSSQYGVLLDDEDTLEPGTPGTSAP